jgi:glycosyltransferase involved in cell wall biosynthesis
MENPNRVVYSVVIPAWNEAGSIVGTIAAIRRAQNERSLPGEIVVVDNNSTDNTATLARDAGAIVVFESVNQISRARNTGARHAQGKYLFFVDADTLVSPALIRTALTLLESGSVIGGGAVVAFDRPLTFFARCLLRLWNWWSVRSSTAAGCFIFCIREAFELVGGFDERQYVAEELYLSREMRTLAKKREQHFRIITDTAVVSSARKQQWFSHWQMIRQMLVLLWPGASRSRKLCWIWYDRRGHD